MHVCGVCFLSSEEHAHDCCSQPHHLTPPCCEGCGCRWYEENHLHWMKPSGTNYSGTRVHVGDLVEMGATRHRGRKGEVLGRQRVLAGGAGTREVFRVHLFAVGNKASRFITCNPSSTLPLALVPVEERA